MKTIAQPAVITPTIIGLALLAAAVVYIGVTGKRVPLLTNVRVDIILLVIIGIAICTQGGIGRAPGSSASSPNPSNIVLQLNPANKPRISLLADAGYLFAR